jgi:hypothetical protein
MDGIWQHADGSEVAGYAHYPSGGGDIPFCWNADATCRDFNFERWANYEPNDYGGIEECASMYSGGTWNDEACTAMRGFVCEIESCNARSSVPIAMVEVTMLPLIHIRCVIYPSRFRTGAPS